MKTTEMKQSELSLAESQKSDQESASEKLSQVFDTLYALRRVTKLAETDKSSSPYQRIMTNSDFERRLTDISRRLERLHSQNPHRESQ